MALLNPLTYLVVLALIVCEFSFTLSVITPLAKSYSNTDADFVDVEPANIRFDAYYQGPSEGFEQILWGYQDPVGPDMWPFLFATECAGRQQSPINLVTSTAVSVKIPEVLLYGYNTWPNRMKGFNNGHIIKFKVRGNYKAPAAMANRAATSYDIEDIHFHWGSHNFQGSEHTLDGRRFVAEMHIVHKLRGQSFAQSAATKGGIAVLGVFLDIGPVDNPAYQPLIDSFQHIIYKNDTHPFTYDFPLRSLLPSNTQQFFRYQGSLTTPMCNEIVLWSIFRNPVTLSWRQVVQLRALKRTYRSEMPPLPMTDNWRPIQLLNDRPVYKLVSEWDNERQSREQDEILHAAATDYIQEDQELRVFDNDYMDCLMDPSHPCSSGDEPTDATSSTVFGKVAPKPDI